MNPPDWPQDPADTAHSLIDKPSKSERKRTMHRLQDYAELLGTLNAGQLARAPISEDMRAAVLDYQGIKAHEARRRQGQYLGKKMREEDAAAIEAFLQALEQAGQLRKGSVTSHRKNR